MPRELIPELHDVLKLTILKHNFSDFGPYQTHSPRTPTWPGVLQHHLDEYFPAYPTDRDTFLLHMADGLAANFSRHPQNIQHDTAWTVHVLWNPKSQATDRRLKEPVEITEMLRFLAADPSFEQFYIRYEQIFRSRAEDAHPGQNVTTLETHVRLVGRFYRLLHKSRLLTVSEEEAGEAVEAGLAASRSQPPPTSPEVQLHPAQLKPIADLRARKKREWQLHLIRCRPRLLMNPFRARDLNAFACLEEFLQQVHSTVGDNVLFASADDLLLCSDSPEILNEMKALATPLGIALDIERDRQRADMASAKLRQPERRLIYPELSESLAPPLCEACQMQRATRIWPQDYVAAGGAVSEATAQGTDHVCETCYAIRSRPSRLKKLAHWDEWARTEVIWLHLGLDFDHLCNTLHGLYWDYLRRLDPATPEDKAEVRFSLLGEFQRDYEASLSELANSLGQRFAEDRIETLLPNFFCIRAESGEDVFEVLRCHLQFLENFFPAFLGDHACPLRLSVAICDSKHPFFEVWRLWERQESEVQVLALGHGQLSFAARKLERFLQLAEFHFNRSALHNLAEISRISQQLAELRFRAKGERGERQTFERLGEFLPLGLDFDGILTLAKLKGV